MSERMGTMWPPVPPQTSAIFWDILQGEDYQSLLYGYPQFLQKYFLYLLFFFVHFFVFFLVLMVVSEEVQCRVDKEFGKFCFGSVSILGCLREDFCFRHDDFSGYLFGF